MLLSMTGFGEARIEGPELAVRAEVRAVNNRYFKLGIRCNESLTAAAEAEIEALLKQAIRRGTVQVNLFIDRPPSSLDFRVNREVLLGYWNQLVSIAIEAHATPPNRLDPFLQLPGVISDRSDPAVRVEEVKPILMAALEQAVQEFQRMRQVEGRNMADDLRRNCRELRELAEQVRTRAPAVIENYRRRLRERLNRLLGEVDIQAAQEDILREVGLFAERSDISEELVRFQSHVEQFLQALDSAAAEGVGRRLDFMTQEMVREINTLGAKANDVEISGYVVRAKTIVERIREMVQNVE
ncbi:MAG: YicC family protein [Thermogutta sp.]|nr:YicC family protein [Thermogutta sp.]